MGLTQAFVGRVSYPLWERWQGVRDLDTLRELTSHDALPPAALRDLQRRRLRDLLLHAHRTVPFYRRRFDEVGFDPARFEDPEQLAALPVVTKADLRAHLPSLVSSAWKPSRLREDLTSGSTGEPTRFYLTEEKKSFVRAATLRENAWLRVALGDRILKFWGSPRKFRPSLTERVTRRWVRGTRVVDGYDLSAERIEQFLQEWRRYRPDLVIAYGKSIYFAAQYARRRAVELAHRPRAVVVTAEGLTPGQRQVVAEVFGTPVVNRYASRELGQIASCCGVGHRLHTIDDGCVVELVPLEDGDEHRGRIVVTDLVNEAMPLIRYDTGDVGVRALGPCECGRPYGLLEDVEGRVVDLLRRRDGQCIHGFLVFEPFEVAGVASFQVVQESLDLVQAKVVPADGTRPPDLAAIRRGLHDVLGPEVTIDIEVCATIPAPSGKHRFTISRVNGVRPAEGGHGRARPPAATVSGKGYEP